MKNNLPRFSHDNDAWAHPKLGALRARYGWEGYGRFWALNEMIAAAEECRLDLSRPLIRSSTASRLGLSLDEFEAFLAFLSDPDQCGLVNMLDGVLSTDRTQEDYARVKANREKAREGASQQPRRGGRFTTTAGAGESTGKTTGPAGAVGGSFTGEQSRLEQTRLEQSRAEQAPAAPAPVAAACSPFSPAQIQERLAFAALDVTLDDAGAGQVAQALQTAGCEDLAYLDWALERIRVRANGKPIANPAGYLLSVVGLSDWLAAWRQEGALRTATGRRPPAPAPPEGPPEPDNPAEVARLLAAMPWKPGGHRVATGPPARDVTPEDPPAQAGAEPPETETRGG